MNTTLPGFLKILPKENTLVVQSAYFPGEPELLVVEQAGESLLPGRVVQDGEKFWLTYAADETSLTLEGSISQHKDGAVLSIAASGQGIGCRVFFPFLQTARLNGETKIIDFFSLADHLGQPVLHRRDYQAPLVFSTGSQSLILLQEGGLVESDYDSKRLAKSPGMALKTDPGADFREIYRAHLVLQPGGWREAFARIREEMRKPYDLSEYQREDLAWYSDQFVQHFTFLYGREILNLERGEFELERFLDEAERDFGGYDGFLIWVVYPRVGVDERPQWQFYDDVPGGREGLLEMSKRARERGVRFFVPYKPWDRSAELHGKTVPPDEEMLAQLIEDTQADGVFLDTMDMITPEFRQAIDRRKPGVVFCSEGRTRGEAMEIVTGCWDQSSNRGWGDGNWCASPEVMPLVDLWRFILPEHRLFVINRHSMAKDRITITMRGFFNGMGWVVWQDIFGLTLPYTAQEAALLKKCRTIFRENRQAVNCAEPTPLVETLIPGLWANEFPGESKRMWTLFNENIAPVRSSALPVKARPGCHFVDVWNGREIPNPEGGILAVNVEAGGVGCVVEYPSMIIIAPDENQVRVKALPASTQLTVQTNGREQLLDLSDGWAQLPKRPERMILKLIRDGEVLDQMCINGAE